MDLGGTVVTFELDAPQGRGKERAFEVLDALQVVDISNNLGDAKSLATHRRRRRTAGSARTAAPPSA